MRIYRLYGAMDLREEEKPMPVPGAGEVLIRTEYVGLCGSDLPRILHGKGVPSFPTTLGHEFSASVVETGEGVTELAPGDNVVIAPRLVCGTCVHCKNGNAGQCVEGRFLGLSVPDVGGFAEYNVLPAANLVKLPEGFSLVEAAMVEPITVGLHALSLMRFDPEKPVAIIGVGTIGTLIIQSMRALGAKRIYAFDLDDGKLDKAARFGASHTYNTGEEGYFERFMADTENYGAPQVIEAVGAQSTILLALKVASVMADIAIIGDVFGPITIPEFDWKRLFNFHQLHLHGVYQSYTDGFPGKEFGRAVQFIDGKKINLKPLIQCVDSMDNLMRHFTEPQGKSGYNGKMIFHF